MTLRPRALATTTAVLAAAAAIATDLAVASPTPAGSATAAAAKTYVLCNDSQGDTVPRTRPKVCVFYVAHASSSAHAAAADEVYVDQMAHWRGWGGAVATVRGTYRGNMGAHGRGAVRLSRRQSCPGYGYVYTHFTMRLDGERRTAFDFALSGCA